MYKNIKEILRHTIIYGLGIYIGKAIGFFMIPVYTRFLTPADYGVLELLNLTSYIIVILLTMGISSAVYRFYFQHDEEGRKEVISTALVFVSVFAIFMVMLLSSFSQVISSVIFKTSDYSHYLFFIFVATFFDLIALVPITYVRALKRSTFFTAVSILRLTLALSLNIYLIVFCKMGIMGVLWSGLISSFVVAVITLAFTFKKVGLRFSFSKAKEMLKYGLPLMPETIFIFVIHFSNRQFLQHFLTLDDVGVFSLGYKFSMMLPFLISQPFNLIWSTYRFEIFHQENAKRLYSRILTYYFLVTAAFFVALIVLIKDIVFVLSAESFHAAYKVVPLISCGLVLWGLVGIFDLGILLKKKTYLKAIFGMVGMALSLLLNYLLIPTLGIFGAAVASFCAFASMSLMSYISLVKLYPLKFEWKRILKIISVAMVIYAGSWLVGFENIYIRLLGRFLILLCFVPLLFVFNFFYKSELNKIMEFKSKGKSIFKGLFLKRNRYAV